MDNIKRYNKFLENISFGKYVEKHMKDENLKRMILPYLNGYEKDLNISNIVDLLDKNDKQSIINIIDNYYTNGLTPQTEVNTSSNVILESSGKGVFTTFLKSITALTKTLIKKEKEEYLLYYQTNILDYDLVNDVFNRFKSLSFYITDIDIKSKNITIFYGLNDDLDVKYGILVGDKEYLFGYFKLTKSSFNSLKVNNSKSSTLFIKELDNLSVDDLNIFKIVKKNINNIPIFEFKNKTIPTITNGLLKWGYYGLGTWKNGDLVEEDLLSYKNNIKNWILNSKLDNKILFRIYTSNFWFMVEIKIKK